MQDKKRELSLSQSGLEESNFSITSDKTLVSYNSQSFG